MNFHLDSTKIDKTLLLQVFVSKSTLCISLRDNSDDVVLKIKKTMFILTVCGEQIQSK